MEPNIRLAEACERAAALLGMLCYSCAQKKRQTQSQWSPSLPRPLCQECEHDTRAADDLRALAAALRTAHHADPDIHGKRTSYVVNLGET